MSKGTAWFPCYASDLLGSMRWKMMTPAQRGAYWQLICWQMQSADGHLPDDLAQLSALADLDVSAHPILLEAFPVSDLCRRANPKALKLWQARAEFSSVMSACGKEGNAKRWGRQSPTDRVPNRLPDQVGDPNPIASGSLSTSTSTSTSTSKSTPTTRKPNGAPPAGFDEFWAVYPRKVGKTAAAKAWERAKSKPDTQTIVAIIERQKTWPEWKKDGGQFIPHPATWLNGGRWEDQPIVSTNGQATINQHRPPILTTEERRAIAAARGA